MASAMAQTVATLFTTAPTAMGMPAGGNHPAGDLVDDGLLVSSGVEALQLVDRDLCPGGLDGLAQGLGLGLVVVLEGDDAVGDVQLRL